MPTRNKMEFKINETKKFWKYFPLLKISQKNNGDP